jgi:pyruvate dehydrogenase E2 component (dihydrolipoamide acetyltransferase)
LKQLATVRKRLTDEGALAEGGARTDADKGKPMPIELKMPALSPTMEEGTLAKWLVKEGDTVKSGDILAEIETDKATMEFEAVDEGKIAQILVPAGTDGVKVGAVIAMIAGEDEDASAPAPAPAPAATPTPDPAEKGYGATPTRDETRTAAMPAPTPAPAPAVQAAGDRVKASPLARRLAEAKGIDLATLTGSGPGGRIVKADIDAAQPGAARPAAPAAVASAPAPVTAAPAPAPAPAQPFATDIPHEAVKLSNMRKTVARRLTEAKQTIPHYYLTSDVRLDALLKLRGELNGALEARGVKLSVNDMLIKALAVALRQVPECNVSFTPDQLIKYSRADIAVAVSIPGGLITPIVTGADGKGISTIATEMKDLAGRAKEGKLQPHEYQGGTASLSNLGMFGVKQFEAVINPPQGMIMAVGAGDKRPYVVDDALQIATVMSATGSFDHRAIDGADGARLMQAFKELVEKPLGLVA